LEPQRALDVEKYRIELILQPEKRQIKGKTIINFRAVRNSDSLVFNFYENMKIAGSYLNGEKIYFEREQRHIISRRKLKRNSDYMLEINYSGEPVKLGLGSFNFSETDGQFIAFTINEPVYASTWFPCSDRPDDKAAFEISVTNDSSYVSIANGKLDSVKTSGSNRTYFWSENYPISTYLSAIYSGPFDKTSDKMGLNGKNTELEVYTYSQTGIVRDKVISLMKKSLSAFSGLYGAYSFPDDKLAVIEIPWIFGGIENHSAIGIGSRYFSERGFYDQIFIHEIAHHWWGNSVTLSSWRDIWLNEGFANYSEALFYEKLYGESAGISTLNGMPFKNYDNSLSNPGTDALSKMTYFNGAWVLYELRRELGDGIFFDLLKEYYNSNKYLNVDVKEFQKICESISGRNLDWFFEQWVYSSSVFPKIEATKLFRKGTVELKIVQDAVEKPFRLSLDVKFVNTAEGTSFDSTIVLSKKTENFLFPSALSSDSLILDPYSRLPAAPEIK